MFETPIEIAVSESLRDRRFRESVRDHHQNFSNQEAISVSGDGEAGTHSLSEVPHSHEAGTHSRKIRSPVMVKRVRTPYQRLQKETLLRLVQASPNDTDLHEDPAQAEEASRHGLEQGFGGDPTVGGLRRSEIKLGQRGGILLIRRNEKR